MCNAHIVHVLQQQNRRNAWATIEGSQKERWNKNANIMFRFFFNKTDIIVWPLKMSICTKLRHNRSVRTFSTFRKTLVQLIFMHRICWFFYDISSLNFRFIKSYLFLSLTLSLRKPHTQKGLPSYYCAVSLLMFAFKPEERLFCYFVFVHHSPFNLFTFATLCVQINERAHRKGVLIRSMQTKRWKRRAKTNCQGGTWHCSTNNKSRKNSIVKSKLSDVNWTKYMFDKRCLAKMDFSTHFSASKFHIFISFHLVLP